MGLRRAKATKATRLVEPRMDEVSGVDHPAHEAPGWLIMKAVGDPELSDEEILKALAENPDHEPELDEGDDMDPSAQERLDALTAELATEKAARRAIEETVTKAAGSTVDPAQLAVAVAKATADAADEARFEKAMEGVEAATKAFLLEQRDEVRKARKMAEGEREARITREYLAVAKAEFPTIAASTEQAATLLRSIDDRLPADQAAEVKRVLKATQAQAAFAQIGGHGQPAPSGGAWGEIQQAAAELRQAHPEMSGPQAVAKATELNPELAARHTAEMRSA